MENNVIIEELKSRAEERVKILEKEIEQNEMFIKCCDDTNKSIADVSLFKKIRYNALKAKNAAENPDIAPADDKEKAEKSITDSSIQLKSYRNNLEIITENLKEVNIDSLVGEVDKLKKYVDSNKVLDDKWLDYSQDIIRGNYYDFNESEVAEVEQENYDNEPVVENEDNVMEENTVSDEVVSNDDVSNEVVEDDVVPVVDESDEADKVVSIEPFVKKDENVIDELTKELDEELDSALKPIQEDIKTIHEELNPEDLIVEPQLENTYEPADFFSFNSNEDNQDVTPIKEVEEFVSARNVDEGPVRVDKIEEVGAPEEVQEEDYTRRLAS